MFWSLQKPPAGSRLQLQPGCGGPTWRRGERGAAARHHDGVVGVLLQGVLEHEQRPNHQGDPVVNRLPGDEHNSQII